MNELWSRAQVSMSPGEQAELQAGRMKGRDLLGSPGHQLQALQGICRFRSARRMVNPVQSSHLLADAAVTRCICYKGDYPCRSGRRFYLQIWECQARGWEESSDVSKRGSWRVNRDAAGLGTTPARADWLGLDVLPSSFSPAVARAQAGKTPRPWSSRRRAVWSKSPK